MRERLADGFDRRGRRVVEVVVELELVSLDVLQVLDALDDLGDMVGGGGETGRER